MNKNKKKIFSYLFYDFVKVTSAPAFLLYRPKIDYISLKAKERINGAALVICNHNGFFDPIHLMFVIWYRRHHFVCLQKFFTNKITSLLFKGFHCIPIDDKNVSLKSFKQVIKELKSGKLVTMFPEGHIMDESSIGAFKSGVILMAVNAKAPIVPVYIAPRKHWYSKIEAVIGEKIDVIQQYGATLSLEDIDNAAKMLHIKEIELEDYYKRRKNNVCNAK